MIKKFTEHPNSVGETYFQHLKSCLKTALRLDCTAGILIIHGFFPFLFEEKGSSMLKSEHEKMQCRKEND